MVFRVWDHDGGTYSMVGSDYLYSSVILLLSQPSGSSSLKKKSN